MLDRWWEFHRDDLGELLPVLTFLAALLVAVLARRQIYRAFVQSAAGTVRAARGARRIGRHVQQDVRRAAGTED